MRRAALLTLCAAALLGASAGAANAATFNVVSTTDAVDNNPGNGFCQAGVFAPLGCTLRAAVMEANALAGADIINVQANTYVLTIQPDATPNDAEDGDLDITQNVTISGAGAASTIVDAGGVNGILDRVFHIPAPQSASATISGLTVTGGRSNADGGGISSEGNLTLLDSVVTDNQGGGDSEGGGIVENGGVGTVTIRNSTISRNIAWFGGGVSENGSGNVEIFDSRIVANRATGTAQSYGGGVLEDGGGALTIERSEISSNVVDGYLGGGVAENGGGPVTIRNSLIRDNRVTDDPVADQTFARGGGIGEDGGGAISVVNSTITGNSVQGLSGERANGGGIADTGGGGVSLLNTTVATNSADGVGGNLFNSGGDAITVKNSIVAAGTPANCTALLGSPITSQGDNIDTGAGCGFSAAGDLTNTDPLLAALANNGGPTPTRALLPGSPAIDAADASVCPPTDQRGEARSQGAGCDIGAFEVTVVVDTTPPETAILSAVVQGRTASFTFSANELGATFECSLDGSAFFACTSFSTPALAGGPHVFRVRARDAAGNVDPTPAVFEFRIPLRLSDLPDPVLGTTVNVEPVGVVLWAPKPGTARAGARASQKGLDFSPLEEARQIPVGSFLDTRQGTVRLQSARNRRGTRQLGRFNSGLFQVLQSRARRARGLTELRLKGASFRRCRTGRRGGAGAAQVSRRTIRRVRSNTSGRFSARGRYSAGTTRGTVWITADRCDGTLTTVKRGKVAVRDFRRKKTIIVRAGKSYLARAGG